jgi:hypothetical protein
LTRRRDRGHGRAFIAMSHTLRENADSLRASRERIEEYQPDPGGKGPGTDHGPGGGQRPAHRGGPGAGSARTEAQRLLNLLTATIESFGRGHPGGGHEPGDRGRKPCLRICSACRTPGPPCRPTGCAWTCWPRA